MVQRALDELAQKHTTLVIAHRLSTIIDSSNIIVLGDGKVIEQGTHQELIRSGGEYKRLWEIQVNNRSDEI